MKLHDTVRLGHHNLGLNPYLHRRLTRCYGAVAIANEGEAMVLGRPVYHADKERFWPNIVHPGEYYRISCPYCSDTRQRLYVNHRFHTVDEETGVELFWLAYCFNQDCLADPDNMRDLRERLFGPVNRNRSGVRRMIIKPGVVVEEHLARHGWPGSVVPVHQLERSHKAVRYLEGRDFDVEELGREYGVVFCTRSDDFPLAERRIVVPIYHQLRDQAAPVMVGWQARYVGDLDFKAQRIPKYYTMPDLPKRLVLYNYTVARQSPVLVITEGVTDAWRVGPEAVALLGKTLSEPQLKLILRWGERHQGLLVILLDGDAASERDDLTARLARYFPERLVAVALPAGRDPGTLSRKTLRGLIRSACRQRGIRLARLRK